MNSTVLLAALKANLSDFDDAVLYESGRYVGCNGIVTRDPSGFKHSSFPVFAPQELVAVLATQAQTKKS